MRVDVDHKHPTMGSLMLLLTLLLFQPLILCGVVSTNDRRWVVSLCLSHYLSLSLSRSLALSLSCCLALVMSSSLARSLSCCVHNRPTKGSLSRSLSFSLSVSHTHSLSRSLALSLSVVLWTTNIRRWVQSICHIHSLSFTKPPSLALSLSRSLALSLSRSLALFLSCSCSLALRVFALMYRRCVLCLWSSVSLSL